MCLPRMKAQQPLDYSGEPSGLLNDQKLNELFPVIVVI